jgi:endonuclease YncB( thermonuclease family)
MTRRPIGKPSWFTVLLIVAAIALWALDQKRALDSKEKSPPVTRKAEQAENPSPAPASKKAATSPKSTRAGRYEIYRNCRLSMARNNDGDSFIILLPDGRKEEFRLYYVDTPESAFKRYAGGDSNHERIRQQAADLGGITPEQAVEIGKKAKAFTLGLLESRPFTIHTGWDSPYHDERYHAFVEVIDQDKPRWLHELLVERGLARLKTKPADLPDGTPASRHREHLRTLERTAKQSEAGAWGL